MPAVHTERDSLGEVAVPDDVYYGAQTARARDNFPVSSRGLPPVLIHSLGLLKAAAARANRSLGLLPADLADAIARAADEVADGRFDDQFVVDVFQTGSGTSSNMNANEVIAHRANEILTGNRAAKAPVHPNDHVNLGQSSNDVFPTAIHLAALLALDRHLLPALRELQDELARKAREFDPIVKVGRTHLQDATPVRLGQEFGAYARMVERGRQGLLQVRQALEEVALGGTAVGTGLNAHPEFAVRALAEINDRTGLALRRALDPFEALQSRHAVVAASGVLKTFACDLMKIANDLRLLSSGPRAGLGEITLPALQPGSSMMPGKVNPVLPESACQVCARVIGNDAAITVGGQSGLLELNVMMPMMADSLLESIALLANVSLLLARKCVAGIEARPERCRELVEQSLALTTALVPEVGYDEAARLARRAQDEGRTVREVARREARVPAERLDRLLDARRMTEGAAGPGAEREISPARAPEARHNRGVS
ncbi:MAG TPA: class II fumarate hydratase [Gemmataceae bacterium]|nr:class II fumarate hydratase [Gemmataceae bacterium]